LIFSVVNKTNTRKIRKVRLILKPTNQSIFFSSSAPIIVSLLHSSEQMLYPDSQTLLCIFCGLPVEHIMYYNVFPGYGTSGRAKLPIFAKLAWQIIFYWAREFWGSWQRRWGAWGVFFWSWGYIILLMHVCLCTNVCNCRWSISNSSV